MTTHGLLVFQKHTDLIAAGRKTIELRVGNKWGSIKQGDTILFPGGNERRVSFVLNMKTFGDMVEYLADGAFEQAGFESLAEAVDGLLECYPTPGEGGGCFVFGLEKGSLEDALRDSD